MNSFSIKLKQLGNKFVDEYESVSKIELWDILEDLSKTLSTIDNNNTDLISEYNDRINAVVARIGYERSSN